MSVAQETPIRTERPQPTPPRRNGRWSGYSHLLMARMLELKREPEVVFWVFIFPLLLALGLGIAFRNKPGNVVSVAIVEGTGSQPAQSLLARSPQHDQFKVMHGVLNERQWRLYVATEAKRRGTGGISQVAREAGVTRKTIRKGLQEVEAGDLYEPGGRIRRKGGGRKQIIAKDETLRADLEELLEPKGDPQSLVRWTTKAMSKLKEALKSQGHTIGETAIRELLKEMGFSLKANKVTIVSENMSMRKFVTDNNHNVAIGYFELDNPRLIKDDELIEFVIELGSMDGLDAKTHFYVALNGTGTTP